MRESISLLPQDKIITPPSGASTYIKRLLEKEGLNQSGASRILGVRQSTVKRLIDGGSLSVLMAMKLNKHFDTDIEKLFEMEAKSLVFKANYLRQSELLLNKLIARIEKEVQMLLEAKTDVLMDGEYDLSSFSLCMSCAAHKLGVEEVFQSDIWKNEDIKIDYRIVVRVIYQSIYEEILLSADNLSDFNFIALPIANNILEALSEYIKLDNNEDNVLIPLFYREEYTSEEMHESLSGSFRQEIMFRFYANGGIEAINSICDNAKDYLLSTSELAMQFSRYPKAIGEMVIARYAQLKAQSYIKHKKLY